MATRRRADGALELGGVALSSIARDPRIGTPTYVYDLDAIVAEARELREAFEGAPHLVAYAIKANSAGPIVKALVAEGCGIDVVSGAELHLAMKCGVAPGHILYSGVAKTDDELDLAIRVGDAGIGAIQIESVEEGARVAARAEACGRVARVSIRLNPGVEADALDTHSYIATGHDEAKFGVHVDSVGAALDVLLRSRSIAVVGVGAHVGSQLTTTEGYLASAKVVFDVAREVAKRAPLAFVDTGGGFGIDYGEGCAVRPRDFIRATLALKREVGLEALALYCEPGRSLVAAHAVLVSRVLQHKVAPPRQWTMIDAGMNDLMRPALYQARHRIVALDQGAEKVSAFRVVGPVCESSDDFGMHDLPAGTREVAILDGGAYGYSMASRYNGRPFPAEAFLRGGRVAGYTPRAPLDVWVEDRLRAGHELIE